MTFDEAFEILIGHEGGYSNNLRDKGGETKYGISKASYPNVNIKELTLEDAKEIYLRDYWNKCHLNSVPEGLRFDMFDMAVNSGTMTSVKILQRAVGVIDDGIFGLRTAAAVNSFNTTTDELRMRFNAYRLMYYTNLSDFDVFGKGWVRRVAKNLLRKES